MCDVLESHTLKAFCVYFCFMQDCVLLCMLRAKFIDVLVIIFKLLRYVRYETLHARDMRCCVSQLFQRN